MKKSKVMLTALLLLVTGVNSTPVISYAQTENAAPEISAAVAGEEERASHTEVGIAGMVPVTADQMEDGVYAVTVETGSPMFRVTEAELTVSEGTMSAVITMGGTGYGKLFMGSGMEAAAAPEEDCIPYVETAEGAYTFEIPVAALDQALDCAAFSKRKEKWYEQEMLFEAESLPKEAVLVELPDYEALRAQERAAKIAAAKQKNAEAADAGAAAVDAEAAETAGAEERVTEGEDAVSGEMNDGQAVEDALISLEDGSYRIDVELRGGTGRAEVLSPALLKVKEQKATAVIEWDSPHYDYMIVNGETYLPRTDWEGQTEDGSVFEIPVAALDRELTVIADTVAMGNPHEIEYTLQFHSASAEKQSSALIMKLILISEGFLAIVTVAVFIICMKKMKKSSNQ